MIEGITVIHCDVTITLINRERQRYQGRCEMFFPARGGVARAWPAATRRGWTEDDCTDADGITRHRCPLHSREHADGARHTWHDLRPRTRPTRTASPAAPAPEPTR